MGIGRMRKENDLEHLCQVQSAPTFMRTPVQPPSELPLGLFAARRPLSPWEKVGLVVGALMLFNLWAEVLGLAAAGNPWGHITFKLQWIGTYQLALIAYAGSLAWLFALWRHVFARMPWVRRVLGWPQLRGVVELPVPAVASKSPESDPQGRLF